MKLLIASSFALLAAGCGDASVKPANDASPVAGNEPVGANASSNAVTGSHANESSMPPFAEVRGAHPTAPEPAPIPAKFRGTWADSKASCADIGHHSRLTISGRTVRYPEFVIFGDSVKATDDQFALKGKVEDTQRPAEAQFFINDDGDVLTDGAGGGAVRVRCG